MDYNNNYNDPDLDEEEQEDLYSEEEQEDMYSEEDQQGKKKKKIIAAVIAAIVAIIILLLCLSQCDRGVVADDGRPTFDLTQDANATDGGIDGKSQEELQEELNKIVEEGMINISMNLNPVFANGAADGNLLIVNEEINRHPQVVEIYRDDTDELIYRSGVIPVGSKIEKGKLNVDLPAGQYACTAYFNSVDENTGELLGKAGAAIEITVQK